MRVFVAKAPPAAVPPLQPKLSINRPGDRFEREADRVADQVMRGGATPGIQRACADCDRKDEVQRQAASPAPPASCCAGAPFVLPNRTGDPLPPPLRSSMETAFGHDFSRVRVHHDHHAGLLSRQIQAQAFTHGSDVYFAPGRFAPASPAGRKLLAHELTHVVQQGRAPHQP